LKIPFFSSLFQGHGGISGELAVRINELEADNLDFAAAIAELRTSINRVERKVYRDRSGTGSEETTTTKKQNGESGGQAVPETVMFRPGDPPPFNLGR